MTSIFLRVVDVPVEEKAVELRRAASAIHEQRNEDAVFERDTALFAAVPRSPFAYWVSDHLRCLFKQLSRFESGGREAKVGLQTSDNFRFCRLSWEVDRACAPSWVPYAKGGAFSTFYANVYLMVRWHADGAEAKAWAGSLYNNSHWSRIMMNSSMYFRAGLTWPLRTNGLSFRAMPAGCIFAHKGPAAFVDGDSPGELFALCALVNSTAFGYLVALQVARTELAQSFEVGLIQQTPVPNLSEQDASALTRAGLRAWSLKRSLDTTQENSHAFLLPSGLSDISGIDRMSIGSELASIQKDIDGIVFSAYGIVGEERVVVEAWSSGAASRATVHLEAAEDDIDSSEDEAAVGTAVDAVMSWLVGVAFGRFDLRLATGERAIPPEPEPFDPLPSRSPGMYPEGEEPAERPDVLVDDEGHADDLAVRAIAIAERVKVDAPENLRAWLAKEFFPLHIKMYSKSRRKAPIYWQLATPSATYSVWLYVHAFSKDTLFRVRNDYVVPKLAHEERRLESLTSELRDGATSAQRKQLAAQEALVEELRAFLDEVKRVAPLWNPNLDDGVIINFAPLWRLVPQNKSWQKELKSTWDALCEGKYDWAHLAMHLWPERVVPKCVKDRSLAIAHGVEEVFWVEGTDGKEAGKWTARKTPTRSVDELVRERTSPAVKAALKSLLEAPASSGAAKKTRRGGTNA